MPLDLLDLCGVINPHSQAGHALILGGTAVEDDEDDDDDEQEDQLKSFPSDLQRELAALRDLFRANPKMPKLCVLRRMRATENGLATANPAQREQMLALGRAGTTQGHWFVRWLVLNYTVAHALSSESPSSYTRHVAPEGDFSLYVFGDGSGTLIDSQGFAIPQAPADAASLARAWSE